MTILGKFKSAAATVIIGAATMATNPALGQSANVNNKVPYTTAAANSAVNTNKITSTDLPEALFESTHAELVTYKPDIGYIHLEITKYFPDNENPDGVMDIEAMRFPNAIVVMNWEHPGSAGSKRQSEILDKLLPMFAKKYSTRDIVRIDIPFALYMRAYRLDAPRIFNTPEKTKDIVDDGYYIPLASISMPQEIEYEGRVMTANTFAAYCSYDQSTDYSDNDHVKLMYRTIRDTIRYSEDTLDIAAEEFSEENTALARADHQPD